MSRILAVIACLLVLLSQRDVHSQEAEITLEKKKDRVTVLIDGELFTEYVFEGYEKPILYPVLGPHKIPMTRDYPMKDDTPNEKHDHPHHKSIWFGHMKVNGESFWHVGKTAGTTKATGVEVDGNTINTKNRLVDRNGKLVANDSRKITFGASKSSRWIDYEVTYHATEGEIVFGDNKDGQMGIRMNAALRIEGPIANGSAVNANGDTQEKIWGKRAPWIDYWAEINGKVVGVAMFDHPNNLRHPTWWHARDYGLLSANPFGIHHFESKKDSSLGEYKLAQGEALTFRHRFLFHEGNAIEGEVAAAFDDWAKDI
ncbi:MAG: PmoA family protein [Planctomycetota bacterium]